MYLAAASINAMVWTRGMQRDYDGWAKNGAKGWAFSDVLPVFKSQEDREGGANAWRGAGGPIHIRRPKDPHPTAPVGSLMMATASEIAWTDPEVSIPAFLTMMTIPLKFSIANGLAFGFIACTLLKVMRGKFREVNWFVYVLAALFIA